MSDSDVVIRVEGLGKKYALHHEKSERYTALRDVVARQARAAGRLLNPFTLAGQLRKAQRQAAAERAESEEEFWALKDVSFEIRRGERVGIIGRNGAGKSTLLKILSRITEPTTGRVEIHGRVASLLEVGTGFHPELTGRENIYLNGAILGMTRWEIRAKFDEIVAFAEVERFLDTPVKRYSSGMYVRLAFAVAAHLEPDVMIIDEVLSVGDASFQKKCLGRIQNLSNENKTLLFVSHQMSAILNTCSKSIVLAKGKCSFIGSSVEGIKYYQQSIISGNSSIYSFNNKNKDLTGKAMPYFSLKDFYITDSYNNILNRPIEATENLQLVINIKGISYQKDERFNLGYALLNEYEECIIMSFSTDQSSKDWLQLSKDNVSHIQTTLDTSILNEGEYKIYLLASIHCVKMLYTKEDNVAIAFEIYGNRGNSPYWSARRRSILAPFTPWRLA